MPRSRPASWQRHSPGRSRGTPPGCLPTWLDIFDPPGPGLEGRARQMLEEERGIVRCVVAELLEGRGQLTHPRPPRRSAAAVSPDFIRATSAVASSRVRTWVHSGLSGSCSRLLIDAAQVKRVESGVPDQLGGDRLGCLVAGQEQDPGRLVVVVVRHDAHRERVEGAHPAGPRQRAASDRSVTCCCPNELAASITTRPSSGWVLPCSASVTAGPGTATSTTSATATAPATEAACARSPSSAASARGRAASRAANVTSWPAACHSLPSVQPTRPAQNRDPHSLLLPAEAISCRDDELATGPVLLHVSVHLHDLAESVHRPIGTAAVPGLHSRSRRHSGTRAHPVIRQPCSMACTGCLGRRSGLAGQPADRRLMSGPGRS